MANVFFTKATQLNLALIKHLQTKGHTISVQTENSQTTRLLSSWNVNAQRNDENDPEKLSQFTKDADVVIHAPNIFDLESAQIEFAIVETIIRALEGTKKTFILASNTWVLGDTGNLLADEETPVSPIALVAPLANLEGRVISASQRDIRTLVIRHSNVFGYEGDFVTQYVQATIREKNAFFTREGQNKFSLVAIEDLQELYSLAIDKGAAGDIFHAANGKPYSTLEFAQLVSKQVGVNKTSGLSTAELKIRYGVVADALILNQQIAFEKTKEKLHWNPRITNIASYVEKVEKLLSLEAVR